MKHEVYNIIKTLLVILFFSVALLNHAKGADGNFDLVWQAKTYTPHWYQGKALAGIDSEIKAAVINRSPYPSRNLDFSWFLNFEKNFPSSGIGKNSFTATLKNYEKTTITVKIYDGEENLLAEKAVVLSADDGTAKVIFYKEHPLTGAVFGQALSSSLQLLKENITIKAEPYFFSYQGNAPRLTYSWKMNNKKLPEENNNTILLERPGLESGSSIIGIEITNIENIFQQKISKEIRINYGTSF